MTPSPRKEAHKRTPSIRTGCDFSQLRARVLTGPSRDLARKGDKVGIDRLPSTLANRLRDLPPMIGAV
jgi:hypothetical protein